MVDTKKLKGIISERDMSQRKIAKQLGMTEKTFYSKMKRGVFDSDEIFTMISILDIDDPAAIFFAQSVT